MNTPDKCPKCGAGPKSDPTFLPIRYTCGRLSSDGDRVETHLCLTSQRDQLAAAIEAQRRGAANAERMLREALGVESGADVLDAIAALRERVKRLEDVGDYWIPRDSDAQEAWAKAKETKP